MCVHFPKHSQVLVLCRFVSPTEVCPFCGKTYKRLKSHLPHCKAAASSKTPPSNSTASQTSSSRLESAAMAEKAPVKSLTSRPQPKKIRKVSVVSSPVQSENTSSSSESLSSASPPPSTKKKKQSEKIKSATVHPSATISLVSTQSHLPAPAAATSKPKKKSVRALIEAAKSPQVSKGSPEALEELPSASAASVVDPRSSAAQTGTKTHPVTDNTHPAKVTSKTKAPKTRTPGPTTKDSSGTLDCEVSEGSSRLLLRDEFFTEREMTDLSKPGGGHRARISLQDVRAALGRANGPHHSSRPSILGHIGAPDRSRPSGSVSPVPRPAGNHSDQLANTSPQHTQSVQLNTSEPGGASPSPLRRDAAPPSEPTPDPRDHLSSQASRARSAPRTVSANQAGKVEYHVTHNIPTISFAHFPSFHLHPLSPGMCAMRAEQTRADKMTTEKWRVRLTSQNMTNTGTKGLYLMLNREFIHSLDIGRYKFLTHMKHPYIRMYIYSI